MMLSIYPISIIAGFIYWILPLLLNSSLKLKYIGFIMFVIIILVNFMEDTTVKKVILTSLLLVGLAYLRNVGKEHLN